ncbi:hypothetical protein RJ640_002228 [Escallonia rubra]|uniref:Leucine-rich repeat-containing N-terminal plant-type domain-containing protein n=1 Tax=Escallonia rubra TaxID=112253 RepID=A0AA88QZJ2_9ASTE|nr:hypothetical protein RJ640_002228 [Escallonia rubra]
MGREHFQILPLILLALLVSVEASPTSIDKEMAALVKFKESLNDTNAQLSSWIGEDFCKWKGVGCNNETGHVEKLDLGSIRGLGGQISPSLLDLKYLNYLELSNNYFQGMRIPSFLGSLEQLTFLDLSGASFAGMVPPHLGNLSNLRHLDLSSSISSWAANLHWLSGLSSLEYLNMRRVNISLATTHWLQAINMLPFLTDLYISHCYLTNLPPSLLPSSNLTSLSVLDLSDNNFISSVPQWLFNISTLVDLELGSSSVKGLYPHLASGNFCGFRKLGLEDNDIMGEISEVVRNLAGCTEDSLDELSLAGNRLSVQLPDSIGHFKKLRSISLDGNLITGPIPASIGELSNLESLDLFSNKMNGSIAETLGTLGELNYLDLRENDWEGYLWQNHLQGLAKLDTFMISSSLSSRKALVFNISNGWVPPFNLTVIAISHCDVGLKFPTWLESQTQLANILLTDLAISDTIPNWIWKLSSKIGALDLSNNQLRGELPISLPFSPRTWVDLSSNRLEVPFRFGLMRGLHILDLAQNDLSGSIPACLGNLSGVSSLASNHQQSLVFPVIGMEVVTKGRELRYTLTLNLVNIIDFSSNNLTGEIPEEITSLSTLGALNLSHNQLKGWIPQKVGGLHLLETLDLSSNHLSGQIPATMTSMTSLNHLNLSWNNFSGPIPSANQFLTFNDPSIYEGNPQLCGSPLSTKCTTPDVGDDGDRSHANAETDIDRSSFWSSAALPLLLRGLRLGLELLGPSRLLAQRGRRIDWFSVDPSSDRCRRRASPLRTPISAPSPAPSPPICSAPPSRLGPPSSPSAAVERATSVA